MILTTSDVASLSTSLSRWEIAEYIFAGLVTLACAGEYIADFTTWFTGGREERRQWLARTSTLLLIASLSLELVCLVKTNSLSGILIGSLSEKAEEADGKARAAIIDSSTALSRAQDALTKAGAAQDSLGRAEHEANTAEAAASSALSLARGAREEADSFEHDIVSAKEQAAQAESNLADARERAKKIEEKLAWRRITPSQRKRMVEVLVKFKGQHFDISKGLSDIESTTFADEIRDALVEAGWVPRELGGLVTGINFPGVKILVHRDSTDLPAAIALLNLFQSREFNIKELSAGYESGQPGALAPVRVGELAIHVGRKPE